MGVMQGIRRLMSRLQHPRMATRKRSIRPLYTPASAVPTSTCPSACHGDPAHALTVIRRDEQGGMGTLRACRRALGGRPCGLVESLGDDEVLQERDLVDRAKLALGELGKVCV